MAIKLKVSETSAKLKATSTDALQFGVEQGIPIYPDPYEGSYEVTPTESEQTLLTNGLMMNDDVTVEAIPSDYVGSEIGRRDSTDLTSSGATVSAPSGYYEENASKTIPSGTVVPANAITAVGATLTASNNKLSLYRECLNAPYVSEAGYIESGTQGKTQITLTADVNTRTSSDLTASGNTVTAPAGYYGSSASKSVQSGSATTPTGGITADPSISVSSGGLITASVSKSESITPIVSEGYVTSGTAGTITFSGSNTSQLSTQSGKTVTPTESEQTAVASGKYTTGAVKVGAIDSNYVGSNVTRRDSTDLSESSGTVTVPSGFYENGASKTVAVGTEGTPTATKGTVSNHSISVTPSVTNTAGYISGETKTGTAVTVSASELVSNTLSITGGGTYNVTNYASASVPSGSAGTPTATKGTVSNHSISVTPSVTNTTGYITGSTKTGTAVSVSASELVSGTKSISSNGTGIDVTNYASVNVAVPSGSPSLQTKSKSYTPTESQQTEAVSADTGYDGLDTVNVTVGAISSTYVGTGIDRRDSTNLSANGATVTAPAGYYQSAATKTVTSGTAGTPTATKGTVSNHSVSVTPSVTNTTGYITGSTKTGTAVTVSASELVSGSETKTANGTYDVTNLAELVVNVSGGGTSNFTLLGTKSLGTISTTSTTDTDTGQTIVLTGWNDYDLLVCECSVNTKTNGRHAESTRLAWLTASSSVATKNGCTFATATHNTKLSSSGTATTRSSTTAYGVYAKAGTISGTNLTITIYQRYNSTQTGTINGSYTMRVYGCKIYDLIGG